MSLEIVDLWNLRATADCQKATERIRVSKRTTSTKNLLFGIWKCKPKVVGKRFQKANPCTVNPLQRTNPHSNNQN